MLNCLPFKRFFILCILISSSFTLFPPKAKAIDPISMGLLMPVASSVIGTTTPYVIRGVKQVGLGLLYAGKDVVEILFYLPLGLGESTIGAPFSLFTQGAKHMLKGGIIAPGKLIWHVGSLPVRLFIDLP
jgi:hypothetical protein